MTIETSPIETQTPPWVIEASSHTLSRHFRRLRQLEELKPQIQADIQHAINMEQHYGKPAGHIRILTALSNHWPHMLNEEALWAQEFHTNQEEADTSFYFRLNPEGARAIMRVHTANARRYIERYCAQPYLIQNIRAKGLLLATAAEFDPNQHSTRPEIERIAQITGTPLIDSHTELLHMACQTILTPLDKSTYSRLCDTQFFLLLELLKQFNTNIDCKELGSKKRLSEKETKVQCELIGRWVRKMKLPYIVSVASNINWVYIKNR